MTSTTCTPKQPCQRRISRRRFLRYAGLAGLTLLSGKVAAPLFESRSNQADADQSHQVYFPLIAKTPAIPPLSQELVQEAYQFYSLGDPVSPTSLRFEFKPNLNNPDQPSIIFARDPETNEIMLATRYNLQTQEQEWHVAKLRDLADAVGLRIGTSVDGSEDWRKPEYIQAATDNFNSLKPAGAYLDYVLKEWGPYMGEEFARWAAENNMVLEIAAFFWHQQEIPVSEPELDEYIDSRIRQLLGFVQKGHHAQIPVLTEALWCIRDSGICGWEDSPLYARYGDRLISAIYLRAYQIATEMGFTIGPNNDIEFLYVDYGIEMPEEKTGFVYQQLLNAKEQIASELGISPYEVQLSVGIEGHILAERDPNVPYLFSADELTLAGLKSCFTLFKEIGPVYVNELEVHGDPIEDSDTKDRVIKLFLQAAYEANASGVTLYETFRFNQPMFAGGIRNGLFNENYQATPFYFEVSELMNGFVSLYQFM